MHPKSNCLNAPLNQTFESSCRKTNKMIHGSQQLWLLTWSVLQTCPASKLYNRLNNTSMQVEKTPRMQNSARKITKGCHRLHWHKSNSASGRGTQAFNNCRTSNRRLIIRKEVKENRAEASSSTKMKARKACRVKLIWLVFKHLEDHQSALNLVHRWCKEDSKTRIWP